MVRTCIACSEEITSSATFCKFCGIRQDDPSFLNVDGELGEPNKGQLGYRGDGLVSEPKNKYANYALGLGIASVFLFGTLIVPMASILIGGLSLGRASELKALGVKETGFGFSLAGLILGVVYGLFALVRGVGLV